jgi:hypothetical protein
VALAQVASASPPKEVVVWMGAGRRDADAMVWATPVGGDAGPVNGRAWDAAMPNDPVRAGVFAHCAKWRAIRQFSVVRRAGAVRQVIASVIILGGRDATAR